MRVFSSFADPFCKNLHVDAIARSASLHLRELRWGAMSNLMERAIALASSGEHTTLRTIREKLHKEGFSHRELVALSGRSAQRQLRILITQSQLAKKATTSSDSKEVSEPKQQ